MKFFKFLAATLCVALVSVVLLGCEFTTRPTDEGLEIELTAESQEFTLNVGEKFDPLQGVTAFGKNGEDLLSLVQVSSLVPLDENGCVKQSGTYQVKYVLEIDGEKYNLLRTLVVKYVLPQGDALVINGDFESGALDPFTKSEFDNGGANLSIEQNEGGHELAVDVFSVSWQAASPRVETNVFALENGKYYEVSFKARANEARTMQVQVGQLISEAPWFYQLALEYIDLTPEMQEYKFMFKADAGIVLDISQIQLLFGFGTMGEHGESTATVCFLDDIKVEVGKVESLLAAESLKEGLAEEGPMMDLPNTVGIWFDQGAWCGAAADCAAILQDGVLTIQGTQAPDSCWFANQVFLYSNALAGGNYTLSFNVNLSVAGAITAAVDSGANQAIKSLGAVEAVAGDNQISITFDAVAEQQAGLSLQFGADGIGNIGNYVAVISDILLVRNGDTVIHDYADPANLLGTIKGAVNEGEQPARANPETFYVWYVQSPDWQCGPAVNASFSYEAGALSVNALLTEEHWWFATQIFYATKQIEAAGSHLLLFKLVANNAGKITVNGQLIDVVAGENMITVQVDNRAGEQIVLSIQLGWEETIDEQNKVSHQLLGDNKLVLSELALDGVLAKFDGSQGQGEAEEFLGLPVVVAEAGEDAAKATLGEFAYWFDRNWCGSNVDGKVKFEEGTLTYEITSFTGTNWWGAQLFWYGNVLESGAELKFMLNSSVAGGVQINGQNHQLVAGDNEIQLKFIEGEQLRLTFQAGTEAGGQLGVGTFIFSRFELNLEEPQVPTEEFLGLPVIVAEAAEAAAQETLGKFAYWLDHNWCGSNVTGAFSFANGTIKYTISEITGSCWFGSQFFWYGNAVEERSELTFTLTSGVAGKITMNGQVFEIVAGENAMALVFEAGEQVKMTFQAGTEADGQIGINEFVLSGFALQAKQPEPQYVEQQLVLIDFEELKSGTDLSDTHWTQEKYTDSWVSMSGQMRVRTVDNSVVVNMVAGYGMTYRYTYTFDQVYKDVTKVSCKLSNHWSGAQVIPLKLIAILEDGSSLYLLGDASTFYQFPVTTGLVALEKEIDAANIKGFRVVTKSSKSDAGYLYLDDVALFGLVEKQPEAPQDPETLPLSFHSDDSYYSRIEGAGIWLWINTEEIGMTNENNREFTPAATVEGFTVVDQFLSDFHLEEGFFRCYVVLNKAEAAGTKVTVNLTLTHGELVYAGSIELEF